MVYVLMTEQVCWVLVVRIFFMWSPLVRRHLSTTTLWFVFQSSYYTVLCDKFMEDLCVKLPGVYAQPAGGSNFGPLDPEAPDIPIYLDSRS